MSHGLNRRHFMGLSAALTATGCLNAANAAPRTVPSRRARTRPRPNAERILVVVQLSGGNDGLSMCVPHGDDAYHRSRERTRITDSIRLDDYHGLHPNLASLERFYKEGNLALVPGAAPSWSYYFDAIEAGAATAPRIVVSYN